MSKFLYTICIVICLSLNALSQRESQGFYFGPKGGMVLGLQNWNDHQQKNPLLAYNGGFFIETYDYDYTGSLYIQIGLHTRGSSFRINNRFGDSFTDGYRFNNLSLGLGLKKRLDVLKNCLPYYLVGVRAEYTLSTNLEEYERFANPFYPFAGFVNNFNYGIQFGGGFEFELSEFVAPFIEFNISPDLSYQYDQPSINNLGTNPWTGNPYSSPERKIRNISFEITLGIRFLRKVIYD